MVPSGSRVSALDSSSVVVVVDGSVVVDDSVVAAELVVGATVVVVLVSVLLVPPTLLLVEASVVVESSSPPQLTRNIASVSTRATAVTPTGPILRAVLMASPPYMAKWAILPQHSITDTVVPALFSEDSTGSTASMTAVHPRETHGKELQPR
jgi:hypothetical protein